MSPADQVLFDQWITRRDASAFTCLAEKYAAMVYAVGKRITGNAHDAEDVAQAAFETLASQRRAPRVHLGAWLHRVATYRALNHLKAEKRRADREARYNRERPKYTDIGWDDIYELVDEAIAALPDKQRDVVVAHYLEGKTHDAIARELGISRPAVTQRVQAGVAGIRAALGKRGVAVPIAALGAMLTNSAEAAAPIALAAQLGKIALSGYVGKTGTGIGLWQGMMAGMGTAKGWAAGAMVVVAAGLMAGLLSGGGDAESPPAGRDALAQANTTPQATPVIAESPIPERVTEPQSDIAAPVTTFTADTRGARIFGKVVDTKGIPVAGAQVRLIGSENLSEGESPVSGEDGSFSFSAVLPATSCWLTTFKDLGEYAAFGSQVELKPVLPGKDYEILMTIYDGVITGRVLDERTKPMPGVQVRATPVEYRCVQQQPVLTDKDGRYRIAGTTVGEFEMEIQPVNAALVKTGVIVRSDGIGVRQEVNLVYKKPKGGKIEGRVTNEMGGPIEKAHVVVHLIPDTRTSLWAVTDTNGYYSIDEVPEGPNLVRAMHVDYGERELRNVAPDGLPAEFTLPQKGEVRGRVVNEITGDPITSFRIEIAVPTIRDKSFLLMSRWELQQNAEGRFGLMLPPGDQSINIDATGFSDMSYPVSISSGAILEDVRIPLKPSQALRGLVTDADTGAPVPGARIFRGPLPVGPLQTSKTIAHTDDAGTFIVEDASPEGESLSVTHPSYAAAWAQVGASESEVTIAMSVGVEVTGTVHLNDAPVEGIAVHATAPNRSDSALAQATTDAEGHFTLKGLPEKDVVLYAKLGAPHAPQERTMYFQPDEAWRAGRDPVHLDFVQSRAELSVTLVKGSDPQPGIRVYASQDLGGGYMDSVSVFTGQMGSAILQDLTEGRWDLQIFTPGAKGPDNARRMTPVLTAYQMLMLQLDLDPPYTESINIVNYPNPDVPPQDAPEKPVDGEQVMVPLVLESGGEREWPSPGPS